MICYSKNFIGKVYEGKVDVVRKLFVQIYVSGIFKSSFFVGEEKKSFIVFYNGRDSIFYIELVNFIDFFQFDVFFTNDFI